MTPDLSSYPSPIPPGASQLNERVNILEFFTLHVLPELEDPNVNARPIVRADCIKFVATFRQQFSVDALRAILVRMNG